MTYRQVLNNTDTFGKNQEEGDNSHGCKILFHIVDFRGLKNQAAKVQ